MAEDSILITFSADIASYEKAIDTIETKTLGVQKVADETSKRISSIGKGATFAPLGNGLKTVTQEATKANRELKKTGEEITKSSKQGINGFIQLRNELKALRGQMAILASQGKENTAEFKALQIQAGALQDQMKDLGTSIQLNAGDPLENLSGGVNSVRNSFQNLDFDGVSRGLGALAGNIKRVDFSTFTDGISQAIKGIGSLGKALITSPIFLIGAAIAGVIAGLLKMTEATDEHVEALKREKEQAEKTYAETEKRLNREIALLQARGEESFEQEKQLIEARIVRLEAEKKLAAAEVKLAFDTFRKRAALLSILDGGASKSIEKRLKLAEAEAEGLKEVNNSILDARNDLEVLIATKDREARERKQDEDKKSNEEFLKRQSEIQSAAQALRQSEINLIEDAGRRQRQQIQFDFQKRLDQIKGNSEVEKALRISLGKEMEKAIENIARETFTKRKAIVKQEGEDRARKIKQLNDNDLALLESGAKSQDEFNRITRAKRAQEIAKEIEGLTAVGNSIVTIGQSFATLTAENAEEAAEQQKLFASFGIGLNLATSLANIVASATAAAAATGPLAPFTLIGYIASGTAAILGAFAQIKTLMNAPVPKAAAKGDEYVTGGVAGKDSVSYSLMPGERVVTTAVNEKYWDDLHAMHTGKYEKYINEKRILPALRKAMQFKSDSENEGFAANVANAIMTNNWKGGNIVTKLSEINKAEDERHNELISALRHKSKPSYRKK